MAIKNYVSKDFLSAFVDSINVFDCRLPVVVLVYICFVSVEILKSDEAVLNEIIAAHRKLIPT